MNRQFPCILKGFYTYFVFDKGSAISLDENCIANIDEINFNDKVFKNITAEYLANTYGEVKSKEHAEFIVKLAEVNGIDFDGEVGINSNYFCFFPSNSKQLTFWRKEKDASKHGSRKQITIPLPPECESADEWPKVGDEVTWGTKAINGEIRGIDNGLAWIKNDHGNYVTAYISELEKPKTPEQELRDELISFFGKIGQNGIVLIGRYDEVADDFLSKYNITKKGEGDES